MENTPTFYDVSNDSYVYRVIEWFMSIPMETVTPEATALTATVTGAMTGAFGLWLGSESKQ